MINTTFTVDGTDYSDTKRIVIDKNISDYNSTSSFKTTFDNPFGRHQDTFTLNEDVLVKADLDSTPTTKVFRGIIEDIEFLGTDTKGKLIISGRDYGAILQDIIVEPRIFKDIEASEIVKSLMRQNVSDISTNNVDTTSTTIDKITFNGVSVFDAIKQISEIAGFFFFVDEDKDLNFKEKDNVSSGLTFDNINTQSASFRQSDDDIFNQVKVVGDRQLTAAQQIFETGVDNVGSVYELDSKPYNTKVTLSGATNQILQPGGILFINDPATDNVKYLVDFADSRIILTSGTAAGDNIQPAGSVVIADYDQSTPLIKFDKDETSINAFGLKQKEIIDKNIKDLLEATVVAEAFIAENKDPKTQGTVKVKGIANVIPGQTCLVNLPTQGQDNQTYTMIRAKYTFNPINNQAENALDITVSRKVNSFIDLFTQHELRLRSLETSEVESSITNVETFTGSIGISGATQLISRDIGSGFYFNVTGHDILNSDTSLLGDVRGGSVVLNI